MGKIFARGLIAITPVAVTIALVVWIFMALEKAFSVPLKLIFGPFYFTGMGVIVALILIFFVGMIINNWVIQKIYSWGERILKRIPIIKTFYNAISDLLSFFNQKDGQKKMEQVVMLNWGGMRTLGFITRENFDDLPDHMAEGEEVAVYVPFSYQIGGFTFMIPKSELQKVDMSVEEGMRFAITAGVLKEHKKEEKEEK